jgi:hypothetical protein
VTQSPLVLKPCSDGLFYGFAQNYLCETVRRSGRDQHGPRNQMLRTGKSRYPRAYPHDPSRIPYSEASALHLNLARRRFAAELADAISHVFDAVESHHDAKIPSDEENQWQNSAN